MTQNIKKMKSFTQSTKNLGVNHGEIKRTKKYKSPQANISTLPVTTTFRGRAK